MTVKTEQATYEQCLLVVEKLLAPLVKGMHPGAATIPLKGLASDHSAAADILEAFARPCLLAAHWLAATGGETMGFTREEIAKWFREGLVAGTDPKADTYWGPVTNYHQHAVEMGVLILALEIAHDHLWSPLAEEEKQQVMAWMRTTRGCGFHRNNHMFFGILPLSFLVKQGADQPGDKELALRLLDVVESMYLKGTSTVCGGASFTETWIPLVLSAGKTTPFRSSKTTCTFSLHRVNTFPLVVQCRIALTQSPRLGFPTTAVSTPLIPVSAATFS